MNDNMACFLEIYQPDGQVYNPNGGNDGRYRLSEMISSSEKTEITIGRTEGDNPNESTDIRLPVNDKKISRKHCSIEIEYNCYFRIQSINDNKIYLRKANQSAQDIDLIDETNAGGKFLNNRY
jgi:pSer/pThr/pTyr-binding forkhead associated (FHA) protein